MPGEIVLAGEVRSVIAKEKDGKIYARAYQVEVASRYGRVDNVDLIDFDLSRNPFTVGEQLTGIHVAGVARDFGGLHVEYIFLGVGASGNSVRAEKPASVRPKI